MIYIIFKKFYIISKLVKDFVLFLSVENHTESLTN